MCHVLLCTCRQIVDNIIRRYIQTAKAVIYYYYYIIVILKGPIGSWRRFVAGQMGGMSRLVRAVDGGGVSPLSDGLTDDDDYIYYDTFSRRFVAQRNASKFTTTVETRSKRNLTTVRHGSVYQCTMHDSCITVIFFPLDLV